MFNFEWKTQSDSNSVNFWEGTGCVKHSTKQGSSLLALLLPLDAIGELPGGKLSSNGHDVDLVLETPDDGLGLEGEGHKSFGLQVQSQSQCPQPSTSGRYSAEVLHLLPPQLPPHLLFSQPVAV